MKFAIIVPTYYKDTKTPKLLARTIRTVFEQTHKDFKLFIIGDRYDKPEEINEIIKDYPQEKIYFENLKYAKERDVYFPNNLKALWCSGGVNAANFGIIKALGDGFSYMSTLNHDDYWDKEYLKSVNEVIEKTKAVFVFSKSTYFQETLPRIETKEDYIELLPQPEGMCISSCCFNFRVLSHRFRDMFESKHILQPSDSDLLKRCSEFIQKNGFRSIFVNKLLCYHEQESYSLATIEKKEEVKTPEIVEEVIEVVKEEKIPEVKLLPKREKITVISEWYNEETIAPYFCNHYKYVDEIHILLERNTRDKTREILAKYPNVVIEEIHCVEGLNDQAKVNDINKAILQVTDGWGIIVDPDEFIYPDNFEDPQEFFKRQKEDLIYSYCWDIYRHKDDIDLDPEIPPIGQRLHGDPNINEWRRKPSVFRAGCGLQLQPGNHLVQKPITRSKDIFRGVHWNLADPIFFARKISQRDRMSAFNKKKGYGVQNYKISLDSLKNMCREHSQDPILPIYPRKIVGNPLVSILIPVAKPLALIEDCLETLFTHTTYRNFEVIIVDNSLEVNNSLDLKVEELKTRYANRILVSKSLENLFHVRSIAQGLLYSRGSFILLFNDDVKIPPEGANFLDRLLDIFNENPSCGIASLSLLYDDGTYYYEGTWDYGGGNIGHLGGHGRFISKSPLEIPWSNGACFLTRREYFNCVAWGVGSNSHYGEDREWSIKVREHLGVKNVVCRDAWIYHFNFRALNPKRQKIVLERIGKNLASK